MVLNAIQEIFGDLPQYINLADTDVNIVSNNLVRMAAWSSLIGVVLAFLAILVLVLINKHARRTNWCIPGHVLTSAFVLVWLAGFVIYDLGLYVGDDNRWSLIANMPMAVIYSLEMFLMESDISAIHPPCYNNWMFMCAFSLVHILAAIVTLAFVIKHFGYNILAGLRMLFEAYVGRKKQTFVFWGLNDASYVLAKDIKKHFEEADRKRDYRIIVVRTNEENTTSVKNGMERLFNFLSLRNNDLDRLIELDCLTTSTYADLSHVKIDIVPDDVLTKLLNLRQLARVIKYKTQGKAHLFLLSDDPTYNIQAVANLKRDLAINHFVSQNNDNTGGADDSAGGNENRNTVTLYCRARFNSLHRVIEDEQFHDSIDVKVIDPSHLSVEILKQDVKYHPVSYVDINKDATVSSPFNALVVGFGEVGMDIVRFLYEFSAFVQEGTVGDDGQAVQRSPFSCHVVDADLKNQAGLFIAGAPSIMTNLSNSSAHSDDPHHIFLHDMDARAPEFYQKLEAMITTLNYIVVAQGDDEMNVSLAVRIFRFAVRLRADMNHFRILVMVKNDEDRHFTRIVQHYNRLWAAEQHAENKSKPIHQRTITTTEPIDEPITIFGDLNEVFSYDFIVADKLKEEAKIYKKRYDKSMEAFTGEKSKDWETEHKELMQLLEPYKGYSPTLSGVMRLRRTQSQNIENCFHQHTKRLLAQVALGDKYAVFAQHLLSRKENEITYSWQDGEPDKDVIRVLGVLARTEHFRWVASHEVLGYNDFGTEEDKDEARLMHGCLKPWESLSARIQSYDYNVVDVSLGIL